MTSESLDPQQSTSESPGSQEANSNPAPSVDTGEVVVETISNLAALAEAPTEAAPAAAAEETAQVPVRANVTPDQNVVSRPNMPSTEKRAPAPFGRDSIVLPSLTADAVDAFTDNSREKNLNPQWLAALTKMTRAVSDGDQALRLAGTQWRNMPMNEHGNPLGMTLARVNARPGEATGDEGQLGLRTWLDMGTYAKVPLFGSGLRLKIDDPGDAALQEALRQQTSERGRIGRETFATSFGARMVFTIETLMRLFIRNVRESTAKENVNLLDHITIMDFPSCVWGLAAAVYNNGFEYHRPCTASPASCNHVETEWLHVARAIYYETNKLSKDQMAHMANLKPNNWTAEDLQKYRDQFTFMHGSRIELQGSRGRKIEFELQVPVLSQVIAAGNDWINYISSFVLEAIGASANPADRDAYLESVARVTAASEQRHWVKSITYGETILSSKEDLDEAFRNTISSDPELLKQLRERIAEFSTKITIAIVGVPNFKCSVCKQPQMVSASGRADEELVAPFDPVQVFFDLMFQRLAKYLEN